MTSISIKSKAIASGVVRDPAAVREQLRESMHQCRLGTLKLFESMDDATFRCQVHPDFSPVGWHLGHIGFTEGLWLLERGAGMSPLFPQYRQLMAQDGLPKHQRVELPPLPEILDYISAVRSQVFEYLKTADLQQQERIWRFILQHESQHTETIAFILQLQKGAMGKHDEAIGIASKLPTQAVPIPAGEFWFGSDGPDALDNEQCSQRLYLPDYTLDPYPVTCEQYRQFIQCGGYQTRNWWSNAGWDWLQRAQVTQPLYWRDEPVFNHHPVCGVSYYEAEAYTRFVGKRLPTEAEWEKAACWDPVTQIKRIYPWGDEFPRGDRCNHDNQQAQTTPVNRYPLGVSAYGCHDMMGNVWEWTSSWFAPYPGFKPYPYSGYSQTYFDQQHRVLRGSSWATRPWAMRGSFRNWYHPWMRQILAGFRCAGGSD